MIRQNFNVNVKVWRIFSFSDGVFVELKDHLPCFRAGKRVKIFQKKPKLGLDFTVTEGIKVLSGGRKKSEAPG